MKKTIFFDAEKLNTQSPCVRAIIAAGEMISHCEIEMKRKWNRITRVVILEIFKKKCNLIPRLGWKKRICSWQRFTFSISGKEMHCHGFPRSEGRAASLQETEGWKGSFCREGVLLKSLSSSATHLIDEINRANQQYLRFSFLKVGGFFGKLLNVLNDTSKVFLFILKRKLVLAGGGRRIKVTLITTTLHNYRQTQFFRSEFIKKSGEISEVWNRDSQATTSATNPSILVELHRFSWKWYKSHHARFILKWIPFWSLRLFSPLLLHGFLFST